MRIGRGAGWQRLVEEIMSTIRKRMVAGSVVGAVVALIAVTRADAAPPGPCGADAQKLCANVAAGGSLMQCLNQHKSELSPECAKSMEKLKQQAATHLGEIREMRRACGSDVNNFCKGVELGGGRVLACLKEHESNLSPSCQAMLKKSASR
jgi:hypothetical protein